MRRVNFFMGKRCNHYANRALKVNQPYFLAAFFSAARFFDDTIVFHGALGAGTNFFASWIVSHRRERMLGFALNGKETLEQNSYFFNVWTDSSTPTPACFKMPDRVPTRISR